MIVYAYRGEYGELDPTLLHTRQASIYFSTDPNHASHYASFPNCYNDVAHAPRVYPVQLEINHPFVNDGSEAYLELSYVAERLGLSEAFRIARKFSDWIKHTNHWVDHVDPDNVYSNAADVLDVNAAALKDLYFNIYPFLADADEVQRLKQLGYDGAIHGGNGQTAGSTECCIFDRSQATSIFDLSLR